jgi:hypothetical protein
MTERDDDDSVDGWQGGGEDNQQLLHRGAINCPAANDHHHRLPGWWLDDQWQPWMEEDGNFIGPGGGADKATAAPPRPSAEDGATSNCRVNKANEGPKEPMEERRSNVVWLVDEGDSYIRQWWLDTTATAVNNGYWQHLSMMAIDNQWNEDGNGAKAAMSQGWLSMMAIDNGYQWQLATMTINNGTRTAREFSWDGARCKDGNDARTVMAQGRQRCEASYQWWPSMTGNPQQGLMIAVDNGDQRWLQRQWCEDSYQWWPPMTGNPQQGLTIAVDNGDQRWLQGQQGSSCSMQRLQKVKNW